MAARALTAAGRRVAGQSQTRPTPFLASSRSGASMNHSSASAQREDERGDAHGPAAEAMTGAQVEAALNRKNVEVLQGEEEQVATVLPDETIGEDASDLVIISLLSVNKMIEFSVKAGDVKAVCNYSRALNTAIDEHSGTSGTLQTPSSEWAKNSKKL
ncbi:unnamed protein product [Triticum turgidum subsp. durum]|uniref:Uncharacterized protein n=1 Tax=Triticum turgidum subsp. durum TaxID=4567 RepID=A0A9R0Z1W4_TRITD|nr:unnamed protein product [Triticum turgidum subsp. durum]